MYSDDFVYLWLSGLLFSFFFFFNDTATTEIYTLSLHDALPISPSGFHRGPGFLPAAGRLGPELHGVDRKSTRLNSSHLVISYAVFCLKKKKTISSGTPEIIRLSRSYTSYCKTHELSLLRVLYTL